MTNGDLAYLHPFRPCQASQYFRSPSRHEQQKPASQQLIWKAFSQDFPFRGSLEGETPPGPLEGPPAPSEGGTDPPSSKSKRGLGGSSSLDASRSLPLNTRTMRRGSSRSPPSACANTSWLCATDRPVIRPAPQLFPGFRVSFIRSSVGLTGSHSLPVL